MICRDGTCSHKTLTSFPSLRPQNTESFTSSQTCLQAFLSRNAHQRVHAAFYPRHHQLQNPQTAAPSLDKPLISAISTISPSSNLDRKQTRYPQPDSNRHSHERKLCPRVVRRVSHAALDSFANDQRYR